METKPAAMSGRLASTVLALVGLAAGLLIGLGIRSIFHESPEHRMDPAETTANVHHEGPGHDEHGHSADDAGDSPPMKMGPDEGEGGDTHGGHGGVKPATPKPAPGASPGSGLLVDLGNGNCPIMGGEPDGETYSEWKGLRVSHCCPACTKRFLASPERILDEAGIDWREAAEAVEKVLASEGPDRDRAIEETAKRWTVLRRPADEEAK